jgi:hypothetical protein
MLASVLTHRRRRQAAIENALASSSSTAFRGRRTAWWSSASRRNASASSPHDDESLGSQPVLEGITPHDVAALECFRACAFLGVLAVGGGLPSMAIAELVERMLAVADEDQPGAWEEAKRDPPCTASPS